MLPDSDHSPPRVAQLSVVESIPLHVSGDLGAPVGGVGLGARSMLWASVPEAAIHKNGYLLAPEDDVRSAAQPLQRFRVDAIAQPAPMKLRAKGELGAGVSLAVAFHGRSNGWRGGRRGFGNDGGGPIAPRSIGGSF